MTSNTHKTHLLLWKNSKCILTYSDCAPCTIPVFLTRFKKGTLVAQSVQHWICDWKVSLQFWDLKVNMRIFSWFLLFVPSLSFGGNFYREPRYGFVSDDCKLILGLESPCWTIPIPSALCAVPVFSSRFKKESPGSSVGRALDFWLESSRFKCGIQTLYETATIISASCAVPVFWGDFKR